MTHRLSKWCHTKHLLESLDAQDLSGDANFTNPSHTCWTRCINWLLLLARAIHSLLTALWGIHCLFPEPPQVFCFFFSQQVLVITCNRLWRGYKICQPSLAIKSSRSSFGTLPLRILYVPVLLGPFQYFAPCSPLLLSFIAQVGC